MRELTGEAVVVVGRVGTPEDVAGAVVFPMTNTFLTGVTLKVDGGEPLT